MIIVPSIHLPLSSGGPTRTLREAVHEWEWLGFHRLQLTETPADTEREAGRRDIEATLREAQIEVQLAGNIESGDDVEALIDNGADFVVLGPRALDEPDWLSTLSSQFAGQLLVAVPARERRVRTRGKVSTRPMEARDFAADVSDLRLAGLVIDFPFDAAVDHSDLALLEDLVEELPFPVLVSGGDPTLTLLRDLEFRGVSAAIIEAGRLSSSFDEQALARSFAD